MAKSWTNFKGLPFEIQRLIFRVDDILQLRSDSQLPPLLYALHGDQTLYKKAKIEFQVLNMTIHLVNGNDLVFVKQTIDRLKQLKTIRIVHARTSRATP